MRTYVGTHQNMVKNIFDYLYPRLIPHENLTKRQTRQPLILLG